ncbi:hypothetical protein HK097_004865 [Rhizophlyctis rosea]|uniref:Uncharacterized protein n=1 Tax=Rhizophlyctis rosea TaxID=64517 RepID=A0AAD5X8Z2_9FUNG|nr:hypothetical protein HK097_004865 [Rhizophlyctis rosea]
MKLLTTITKNQKDRNDATALRLEKLITKIQNKNSPSASAPKPSSSSNKTVTSDQTQPSGTQIATSRREGTSQINYKLFSRTGEKTAYPSIQKSKPTTTKKAAPAKARTGKTKATTATKKSSTTTKKAATIKKPGTKHLAKTTAAQKAKTDINTTAATKKSSTTTKKVAAPEPTYSCRCGNEDEPPMIECSRCRSW